MPYFSFAPPRHSWRWQTHQTTRHSRRVLSLPPESARLPSGVKATTLTSAVWSEKQCSSSPVSTSQRRTFPSVLQDSRPFGVRAEGDVH